MASRFPSLWPDPNSPVLSKIDFGVPLVELFKWLEVRDTLLGVNYKKKNIKAALALARDCKHPDAVWLTSVFEGKKVSRKKKAKKVFLRFENDARALCFAWYLTGKEEREDLTLLHRASEMGNAFACSTLCGEVLRRNKEEAAFRFAQAAISQHERGGFYLLGRCFRDGVACERDSQQAKENYLVAAELGDVNAADEYRSLLKEYDPARWFWHLRVAWHGLHMSFLFSSPFSEKIKDVFSGCGNRTVVYLIGRALKGAIDMEKKRIFGERVHFFGLVIPATRAVFFYESQINGARLAVDTWTLVGTRLHVVKDIRIVIGKMIWEARIEGNYKIKNDPAPLASRDHKRFRK